MQAAGRRTAKPGTPGDVRAPCPGGIRRLETLDRQEDHHLVAVHIGSLECQRRIALRFRSPGPPPGPTPSASQGTCPRYARGGPSHRRQSRSGPRTPRRLPAGEGTSGSEAAPMPGLRRGRAMISATRWSSQRSPSSDGETSTAWRSCVSIASFMVFDRLPKRGKPALDLLLDRVFALPEDEADFLRGEPGGVPQKQGVSLVAWESGDEVEDVGPIALLSIDFESRLAEVGSAPARSMVGRRRRCASIAVFRAMRKSHAWTPPSRRRNRPRLANARSNVSAARSSASASLLVRARR